MMISSGVEGLTCYSLTYRSVDIDSIALLRLKSAELRKQLCSTSTPCIVLATCLRVEVYVDSPNPEATEDHIKAFYGSLWPKVERFYGAEAVKHIFEVSSGLHSQIIGEWEILEQVERALALSREIKCASQIMERVFERAVSIGRRVREEVMGLSRDSRGYPQIAVEVLSRTLETLNDKGVLFIGSGHAVRRAIRYLVSSYRPSIIIVTDTDYEKATATASTCRELCIPLRIDDVYKWLHLINGVFIALPNRGADSVERIRFLVESLGRSTPVVDISTPPVIEERENAYTFHSVQRLAEEMKINSIDLERARAFIEEELNSFLAALKKGEMREQISTIMRGVELISEASAEKLARELNVDGDRREVVLAAFRNHARKILIPVIDALTRIEARDKNSSTYVDAILSYLEKAYSS